MVITDLNCLDLRVLLPQKSWSIPLFIAQFITQFMVYYRDQDSSHILIFSFTQIIIYYRDRGLPYKSWFITYVMVYHTCCMAYHRNPGSSHRNNGLSYRDHDLSDRSQFVTQITVYPLDYFSVLTVLGMHMCLLIEFVVADCAVKPRKVELTCITIAGKGKPAYVWKVTAKDLKQERIEFWQSFEMS